MKSYLDAIIKREQAKYLEQLLPASSGVAAEMEDYAARHNVPIADREVAAFLEITARAMRARQVLEIGAAIGYGALFLAQAVGAEGMVVTIEPDEERIALATDFLTRAGVREQVHIERGYALEVLPQMADGSFDVVYMDAIKEEYSDYLLHAVRLLRVGGVIVADNVLWKGQVAGQLLDEGQRASTEALRAFNQTLVNHTQLRAQVLSVGDGIGYGVKLA